MLFELFTCTAQVGVRLIRPHRLSLSLEWSLVTSGKSFSLLLSKKFQFDFSQMIVWAMTTDSTLPCALEHFPAGKISHVPSLSSWWMAAGSPEEFSDTWLHLLLFQLDDFC